MSLLFLALSLLLREADLALELLLLEIASIRSRSRFSGSLSSSTFILLSGVLNPESSADLLGLDLLTFDGSLVLVLCSLVGGRSSSSDDLSLTVRLRLDS